jgi:hypothetical protein
LLLALRVSPTTEMVLLMPVTSSLVQIFLGLSGVVDAALTAGSGVIAGTAGMVAVAGAVSVAGEVVVAGEVAEGAAAEGVVAAGVAAAGCAGVFVAVWAGDFAAGPCAAIAVAMEKCAVSAS